MQQQIAVEEDALDATVNAWFARTRLKDWIKGIAVESALKSAYLQGYAQCQKDAAAQASTKRTSA